MAAKGPPPSIEDRILSALRVSARLGHGPLTVARLRGYSGLIGRRSADVRAACEALVARGEIFMVAPDRPGVAYRLSLKECCEERWHELHKGGTP